MVHRSDRLGVGRKEEQSGYAPAPLLESRAALTTTLQVCSCRAAWPVAMPRRANAPHIGWCSLDRRAQGDCSFCRRGNAAPRCTRPGEPAEAGFVLPAEAFTPTAAGGHRKLQLPDRQADRARPRVRANGHDHKPFEGKRAQLRISGSPGGATVRPLARAGGVQPATCLRERVAGRVRRGGQAIAAGSCRSHLSAHNRRSPTDQRYRQALPTPGHRANRGE
jgi:hypothetical protein